MSLRYLAVTTTGCYGPRALPPDWLPKVAHVCRDSRDRVVPRRQELTVEPRDMSTGPGMKAPPSSWYGWQATDGWAALASFFRGRISIGDEALEAALSYRLLPPSNVAARFEWGSSFAPLTVARGVVWPEPLPIMTDLQSLAWSRHLRQSLPPPVEARLADLLHEHGRPSGSLEFRHRALDAYLHTWETEWAMPPRIICLARALELSYKLANQRTLEVLKHAAKAWDDLTNDATGQLAVPTQRAWVVLLDTLGALSAGGPESLPTYSFLRRLPSGAPLVEDAWLRLSDSLHSSSERSDGQRARRALWVSLIQSVRTGDCEAMEALRLLNESSPGYLVTLVASLD